MVSVIYPSLFYVQSFKHIRNVDCTKKAMGWVWPAYGSGHSAWKPVVD